MSAEPTTVAPYAARVPLLVHSEPYRPNQSGDTYADVPNYHRIRHSDFGDEQQFGRFTWERGMTPIRSMIPEFTGTILNNARFSEVRAEGNVGFYPRDNILAHRVRVNRLPNGLDLVPWEAEAYGV